MHILSITISKDVTLTKISSQCVTPFLGVKRLRNLNYFQDNDLIMRRFGKEGSEFKLIKKPKVYTYKSFRLFNGWKVLGWILAILLLDRYL